MSLEIIEWVEVATTQWDYDDDTCGICYDSIDSCCAECKCPGESCPPVMGECGHLYHLHCLHDWLQKQNTCPICRKEWKEVEYMETE